MRQGEGGRGANDGFHRGRASCRGISRATAAAVAAGSGGSVGMPVPSRNRAARAAPGTRPPAAGRAGRDRRRSGGSRPGPTASARGVDPVEGVGQVDDRRRTRRPAPAPPAPTARPASAALPTRGIRTQRPARRDRGSRRRPRDRRPPGTPGGAAGASACIVHRGAGRGCPGAPGRRDRPARRSRCPAAAGRGAGARPSRASAGVASYRIQVGAHRPAAARREVSQRWPGQARDREVQDLDGRAAPRRRDRASSDRSRTGSNDLAVVDPPAGADRVADEGDPERPGGLLGAYCAVAHAQGVGRPAAALVVDGQVGLEDELAEVVDRDCARRAGLEAAAPRAELPRGASSTSARSSSRRPASISSS